MSAESRSNFYLGFLFLPRPKRAALKSVYGFCRRIDDIVDSGELGPAQARKELAFWREEVGRLYAGEPTRPMSEALLAHVRAYGLPKQAFLDLIGGVEMDLDLNRYKTFEELEPYLQGVAVAVGLLCVEIFGHPNTSDERVREYARHMGYAFQLTNIIRDVGADIEKGRIYIPLDEIAAAGCSEADLIARRHTPAFQLLMERQYERAKLHYSRARNILDPRDRVSMVPAEVMARVYEDLLERIRADGYRVLFHRASLPLWRKARLALEAWAQCHGIF